MTMQSKLFCTSKKIRPTTDMILSFLNWSFPKSDRISKWMLIVEFITYIYPYHATSYLHQMFGPKLLSKIFVTTACSKYLTRVFVTENIQWLDPIIMWHFKYWVWFNMITRIMDFNLINYVIKSKYYLPFVLHLKSLIIPSNYSDRISILCFECHWNWNVCCKVNLLHWSINCVCISHSRHLCKIKFMNFSQL